MMIDYLIIMSLALGVMLAVFEFAKAIARMFNQTELADGEL